MQKRVWITLLVVVLLLMTGVSVVQAQQANGSIRGTIYNDTNADGVCGAAGTTDATIAAVPIQFTHQNGHTITLTSGNDGTFGLAGVSVGTWSVAVQPPPGWRATSLSPIVVTLTAENNSVGNVNFCLFQTSATATPVPSLTPTPVPPTTLPESGAGAPPILQMVVVLGAVLLIAGMALIIRERRATD